MLNILAIIAVLAVLLLGMGWWKSRRFLRQDHETQATLERVAQARQWSPADLEGLPAPVAVYLGRALPPAGGPLRLARAKMRGQIRTSPASPWWNWAGRQIWCLGPPAFVWSARMAAKPLLPVYVRDGLIQGQGGMVLRLWGWITLARATASVDLDLGSLQRWLAEAPLFPPALLPGPELRWEALGPEAARAVLRSGGQELTAEFHFDPQGLPESCQIEGRPRQQPDGSFAPTPWTARFGQWESKGGMLLPTKCEAAWQPPEGEFTYVRLAIDQVDFF